MFYQIIPQPPVTFLKKHPHLHPFILTLLFQRGIKTKEAIDDFLHPIYRKEVDGRKQYDPFQLKEMGKVVKRILKASQNKERVLVYGDYDTDGVCSAILMIETLERLYGISSKRDYKAKHVKSDELIQVYLPHREEEGYGLNPKAVEYIKQQEVNLVITCDCGSANYKELQQLKELQIDTIVLDHHVIPEERPPAYAFINPRFKQESYTFKELAGCGVVFKVVQGLRDYLQKYRKDSPINEAYEKWSLDLVAIATVADMMSLKEENRILVKWGLVVLNKTHRPGLQALITASGLSRKIGTYEIGFVLAPRINAAGRLDHANVAFDLLRQRNKEQAITQAESLNQTNEQRQKLTNKIFREAEVQIEDQYKRGEKIFVAYNFEPNAWPVGVVGLVAGSLVQQYFRPAFVMGQTQHGFAGSGRSIKNFDIMKLIQSMNDLFIKGGGHPGAVGFTFKEGAPREKSVQEFKSRAEEYAAKYLNDEDLIKKTEVDLEIPFSAITWDFALALLELQPFGQENREPLFISRNVTVESVQLVGSNGEHSRLLLSQSGIHFLAIMFRCSEEIKELKPGSNIDIIYTIEINEWRESKTIQLVIKEI